MQTRNQQYLYRGFDKMPANGAIDQDKLKTDEGFIKQAGCFINKMRRRVLTLTILHYYQY